MEWYEYFARILAGLAVMILLVVKLVQYVKLAIKERNWPDLVGLVMDLMAAAETKFATGAERKEWVLTNVKAASGTINYDINYDELGEMIDNLCTFSKAVNTRASDGTGAA